MINLDSVVYLCFGLWFKSSSVCKGMLTGNSSKIIPGRKRHNATLQSWIGLPRTTLKPQAIKILNNIKVLGLLVCLFFDYLEHIQMHFV